MDNLNPNIIGQTSNSKFFKEIKELILKPDWVKLMQVQLNNNKESKLMKF
jgi:hypothetical protein